MNPHPRSFAALLALALSLPSQADVLFTSDFDANTGAHVFSGNTDNTSGSATLGITDWTTDTSVSAISGLAAISTGSGGTAGGFAQTQGGAGAYANPDVVFLSRNHNLDADRTTSKRGYSLSFTIDAAWPLTTLSVRSGHTTNTGNQDQSYTSTLVYSLSGGSLETPLTGNSTENYGTPPPITVWISTSPAPPSGRAPTRWRSIKLT